MTKPGKAKPENVVAIWLTAEQRRDATALARREGMTLGQWIKQLVLRSIATEPTEYE